MRATPAARSAPAVRRLRNPKVADGIVHHHCSGTEPLGNRFPFLRVISPNASRKGKRRIVGALNRLFSIFYRLNREDGTEGFLLKEFH